MLDLRSSRLLVRVFICLYNAMRVTHLKKTAVSYRVA